MPAKPSQECVRLWVDDDHGNDNDYVSSITFTFTFTSAFTAFGYVDVDFGARY